MPHLPPRVKSARAPKSWDTRPTQQRIRGEQLQRLRARLFEEQPLCVLCLARGRIEAATIRDHIVALAAGGADSESNTQALCYACNETKRIAEIKDGMQSKSFSRRSHRRK